MTRPAAKPLNKPLLVVGLDRGLAGVAFLFSVIVGANDDVSKIAAQGAVYWHVCDRTAANAARIETLSSAEPRSPAESTLRSGQARAAEMRMVKLRRFPKSYRPLNRRHGSRGSLAKRGRGRQKSSAP